MPMIDVYASSDLLPSGSDRRIGEELRRRWGIAGTAFGREEVAALAAAKK